MLYPPAVLYADLFFGNLCYLCHAKDVVYPPDVFYADLFFVIYAIYAMLKILSSCSQISTSAAIPVPTTAVRMPTVLTHSEASAVPVTLDTPVMVSIAQVSMYVGVNL